MDVLLLQSNVYDIPSSRRVGALVHDGAADMRLWPGPSGDRDLSTAWGDGLQQALDTERTQLGVEELPRFGVARVHPGRLHCDFLAWVATRTPEPGTERQPAPNAEALEQAILSVLDFVSQRSVVRVAFPALGSGPGELPVEERLAIIVRAAHHYEDRCFAEGKAPVVEEVLVCDASASAISAARRKVQALAKTAALPPKPTEDGPRTGRGRASSAGARKKKEPARPSLAPEEVAAARAANTGYDMRRKYAQGEHFVHPRFGVGRVERVTPEGAIEVVFEDASVRRMVHARG